ncbi:MAG: hypothetical protein QOK10_1843 [Pseudonocardiales bacterium]|jgi:hypothetical protein|nr:hypothetical protein [Pseudonocardiales bacterium]
MPDLTRRSAITLGGAAALVVIAVPAEAATARSGARRFKPTPFPLRSSFARALGTILTAANASGSHRIKLVDIRDLSASASRNRDHCFNLIFDAMDSAQLPEGTYRVGSPRLASTLLFISPIGIQQGPQRLQALVNRSV